AFHNRPRKAGGMAGSVGGRAGNPSYSQNQAYAFQRLLRDNPELRNLAFRLQAEICLSSSADITRAELTIYSGYT
ncbi:energy transducer TonB, partial [Pseudomonas aeruginosa]